MNVRPKSSLSHVLIMSQQKVFKLGTIVSDAIVKYVKAPSLPHVSSDAKLRSALVRCQVLSTLSGSRTFVADEAVSVSGLN
jgi:hypothetical protein